MFLEISKRKAHTPNSKWAKHMNEQFTQKERWKEKDKRTSKRNQAHEGGRRLIQTANRTPTGPQSINDKETDGTWGDRNRSES